MKQTTITIKARDLRPSKRHAMSSYLEAVDVCAMTSALETCVEKVSLLEEIMTTGLDRILPIQSRRVHSTEPPWITSTLKELIQACQRALSRGDNQHFRELRNRVNRKRKACRAKYFQAKVEHLKECKPSTWWTEVKKLSGCSPAFTERSYVATLLQHLYGPTDNVNLANIINKAFLSPMRSFTPIPADYITDPANSATQQLGLVVSKESVFKKLIKLNRTKVHGPDGIPGWVLKENADLLAGPIADILNSSYREGRLPPSWKEADVVPVPKQKPVQDINKHLRPISLTPILSKIAEEYVVESYVKPAVLQKIDPQQFGTIPKSSTTHALISMMHYWAKSTDGNGSTMRVMLFDFRKAFDLINHHVLARKLSSYDIPRPLMCWIIDFLMDRKQRVKLSCDCVSEWEAVPEGVPQGTKLGPWLFLIMINDLSVADTTLWKYVDDTTLAESVSKNETSCMQSCVDELVRQSEADGFQLNESKCKELRISFSSSPSTVDPITINDKQMEVVSSAKLLGVLVSDDLKWNVHVNHICKKTATRLYFLKQLKRAKVNPKDMLLFYTTCIRPVLEYACPVFDNALPQYLSNNLERLQKRTLQIIYPDLSYAEALVAAGITSLYERRQVLSETLFDQIMQDPSHKLHDLLPPRNESTYCTRSREYFELPICKTHRFRKTFIMNHSFNYN